MKYSNKTVLLAKNFFLPQELRGVMAFARQAGWALEIPQMYDLAEHVKNWHGNGFLTDTSYFVQLLAQRGVKIVGMSADTDLLELAHGSVIPDNRKIGEKAAEYFLRRGYRNFVFFEDIHKRGDFFRDVVASSATSMIKLTMPRYFRSREAIEKLSQQLKDVILPCAVFCNNDSEAVSVLNAAMLANLKVPEELSILGVGNTEMICMNSRLELSSIDTRLYLRGYRAAEELDRIMTHDLQQQQPVVIAPGEVIERQSSNFFAATDNRLRQMLAYIRKHSSEPLQISELEREFNMSKSTIHRIFLRGIGIPPKEFLSDERFRAAQNMLLSTDSTIEVIAAECGFPSTGALFNLFRKKLQMTPGDFAATAKN